MMPRMSQRGGQSGPRAAEAFRLAGQFPHSKKTCPVPWTGRPTAALASVPRGDSRILTPHPTHRLAVLVTRKQHGFGAVETHLTLAQRKW